MPNRVDTTMKAKKAASAKPPVDPSTSQPHCEQLVAAHNSVLALRDLRNPSVDRLDQARFAPPAKSKTVFFIYAMKNVGLAGHAARLPNEVALLARALCRIRPEREKRPQPAVAASGFDPFK